MHWFVLGLAIVFETIGTTALKASEQFTRPGPSGVVIVAYAVSFYLLSMTLKVMPVGVVYAIWSGAGICLIAGLAWIVYGQKLDGQKLDAPALLGLALIVAGILVINLISQASAH
jgi:small multidrug resistance pump